MRTQNKWLSTIFMSLTAFVAMAQDDHRRVYNEAFDVNDEVVININTSYTDIEFETWNKNRVEVEAIIELEDVTDDEAEDYFKSWNFKAIGNSKEVTVSTNENNWVYSFKHDNGFDFHFPDIDMDAIVISDGEFVFPEMLEMPPTPPMPPMPPMPALPPMNFSFDYEEYKERGDDYLKEWKEEWKSNFDEEWEAEMKVWKEEMESRKDEMARWKEEYKAEREKHKEEWKAAREEQRQAAKEAREEVKKALAEAREEIKESRKKGLFNSNGSFHFFSSDEDGGKAKKRIIIKMPKGAKLKLNVRHGEVKMANNIKNIKATLSHTRLLADVIDGQDTDIEVSYSPVSVNDWLYGKLRVNHAKGVDLERVRSLDLLSNSSDVVIGTLTDNSTIYGNFGALKIANIADDFSRLKVSLENSDAVIVLPKQHAFNFYFEGEHSKVNKPNAITVKLKKNHRNTLMDGFFKSKNTKKKIDITAKYSEVVMQ